MSFGSVVLNILRSTEPFGDTRAGYGRDVMPGHPNHFEVTPTRTGTFIGRCTELCGLYHSRMLFEVKIVTPAQFRQWIAAQKAAQTIAARQAAQNAAGSAQ